MFVLCWISLSSPAINFNLNPSAQRQSVLDFLRGQLPDKQEQAEATV